MTHAKDLLAPATKKQTTLFLGAIIVMTAAAFGSFAAMAPAERVAPVVAKAPTDECRRLFDAVMGGSISHLQHDESDACGADFAAWVKQLPDAAFAVEGAMLDLAGRKLPIAGAEASTFTFNVGREPIHSVLVVLADTAHILHFRSAGSAEGAASAINAAAKSKT